MFSVLRQFVSYVTYPFYALLSTPVWIFAAPGKIWGAPVPVRIGIFVGLLLSTFTGLWIWCIYRDPQLGDPALWLSRLPVIAVLIVLSAVASGVAVGFWLMSVPSRFPDIDAAWDDGVSQLEAEGLYLTDFPLYLVIGLTEPREVDAFMDSSGISWIVRPQGSKSGPLYWYASEEEIFLVLTGCVASSTLRRNGVRVEPANVVAGAPKGNPNKATGTLGGGGDTYDFDPEGSGDSLHGGELSYDAFGRGQRPDSAYNSLAESLSSPRSSESDRAYGTIGGGGEGQRDHDALPSRSRDLPGRDQTAEKRTHVLARLRVARQPYAPLNGILSVIPFHMLDQAGDQAGGAIATAVKEDLDAVRHTLGIRAHVLAVIPVFDGDSSYWELIRRIRELKPGDVDKGRFGKSLEPWAPVTQENLEKVAQATCDAFEEWIYKLLTATAALTSVHNGRLFRLLCKMRGDFYNSLQRLLSDGFSGNEQQTRSGSMSTDALPFGGCYVMGCDLNDGSDDHARLSAFAKGVFDKLRGLEGELEWTDTAWNEDNSYNLIADIQFGLSLLLVGAIVAMVIVRFAPQSIGWGL